MYKAAVLFEGVYLAPASKCMELYQSRDPKARQELRTLVKRLVAEEDRRQGKDAQHDAK